MLHEDDGVQWRFGEKIMIADDGENTTYTGIEWHCSNYEILLQVAQDVPIASLVPRVCP